MDWSKIISNGLVVLAHKQRNTAKSTRTPMNHIIHKTKNTVKQEQAQYHVYYHALYQLSQVCLKLEKPEEPEAPVLEPSYKISFNN